MTQYFIESQAYYVRTEFADYDGYYHLRRVCRDCEVVNFGGIGKLERKTD